MKLMNIFVINAGLKSLRLGLGYSPARVAAVDLDAKTIIDKRQSKQGSCCHLSVHFLLLD